MNHDLEVYIEILERENKVLLETVEKWAQLIRNMRNVRTELWIENERLKKAAKK